MPHPRRSRQFRSARARAFRAKDVNLPRLRYIHSICRAVAHEAECVHQLGLAEAELKAAKRSLARPAALPVTLAVVSPPEPRRWPNALLGGTSRRRAQAAEWRATWARWLAADDGR